MILFTLLHLFSISSIIAFDHDSPRRISIRIDEELPLSTIIFTTNPNITYRLFDSGRNQNSFVFFNSTSGNLHLNRTIDREQLCSEHLCSCDQCQLIVELIEWQIPYRLVQLEINVGDLNDHSPHFPSRNYSIRLMENTLIGSEFILEQAKDEDQGENARLTYRLEPMTKSPFELIEKVNGPIALKVTGNVDREENDFYQYRLIASDHGEPSRSNSTILNIFIEDFNDNSVMIKETSIQLNLSEATAIGTILTEIEATDEDIGLNGKIHYSITNGFPLATWMNHFRLDESTGTLSLIHPFDYELEHFYQLTVQVRDLGENSVAKFVTIEISIADENDNDPQAFVTFLQPFYQQQSKIFIPENTPSGQMLAHVSISDEDDGRNGQLSCRIERGENLIGMKMLDQRSFLLIVNRFIDREEENFTSSSSFDRFVLIISDGGEPSRSIRLEYPIEIGDVNDNPPIFDRSINCHRSIDVNENSSNRPVMEVRAIDRDSGENGRVTYSIVPLDDQRVLINDQGQIFLIDGFNQTENYSFQILATDHGDEIQWNSTIDCSITIQSFSSLIIFDWNRFVKNYWYFFIILILLLILFFILCLRHCLDENKTYHLYVTVPRHDEHYSVMESDQISSPSPLLLFPSYQQGKSSIDSRPVSLSISTTTTTTSTSCEIESKSIRNMTNIVRLAEEENSEI